MAVRRITQEQALANGANPEATWGKVLPRLDPVCTPSPRPSFQFGSTATIFTIGSCFARNIGAHVEALGYEIPTRRIRAPYTEWPVLPRNGILNLYTPVNILDQVSWAADIYRRDDTHVRADSERFLHRFAEGVLDVGLTAPALVSEPRLFERRAETYSVYREMFRADAVVITLGLIEAWRDCTRDRWVSRAPVGRKYEDDDTVYRLEVLDYPACLSAMEQTLDIVRSLNPDVRFLVTTSPVALTATFTGDDILVANTHSKSVLRAVAGHLGATHPDVDYFPSYEAVMLTRDWRVCERDHSHVTDAAVGRIVRSLIDAYFPHAPAGGVARQRSMIALAEKRYQDALEDTREGLQLLPDDPALLCLRGQALAGLGRLTEARAACERAIELEPDDVPRRLPLMEILLSAYELSEAERQAREILSREPDDAPTMTLLARCYNLMGRASEAEELAREAFRFTPHLGEPRLMLGRALRIQKRYDEALVVLRAAVRLHRDSMDELRAELVRTEKAAGGA